MCVTSQKSISCFCVSAEEAHSISQVFWSLRQISCTMPPSGLQACCWMGKRQPKEWCTGLLLTASADEILQSPRVKMKTVEVGSRIQVLVKLLLSCVPFWLGAWSETNRSLLVQDLRKKCICAIKTYQCLCYFSHLQDFIFYLIIRHAQFLFCSSLLCVWRIQKGLH